ncbi:MAG: hypothetical protein AAF704_02850 [Cyanobacteria bacterium P01_D01_bin.123]
MALRIEIWGLQLARPFARIWRKRTNTPSSRDLKTGTTVNPLAELRKPISSEPDDLGVWLGAIRLRDLPTAARRLSSSNNVVYLRPQPAPWNEREQKQKVQRIFEQNCILPPRSPKSNASRLVSADHNPVAATMRASRMSIHNLG